MILVHQLPEVENMRRKYSKEITPVITHQNFVSVINSVARIMCPLAASVAALLPSCFDLKGQLFKLVWNQQQHQQHQQHQSCI